jgi:hypothetical protein
MERLSNYTAVALTCAVVFLAFWALALSAGFGSLATAVPYVLNGLLPISLLIAFRVRSKAGHVAAGVFTAKRAATEGAVLGVCVAVTGVLGLFARAAYAAGPVAPEVLKYQLLPSAALLGGALGALHGVAIYLLAHRLLVSRSAKERAE